MSSFAERNGTRVLLALSACILLAVPFVSCGFFNVDEALYFLSAKTLATTGHLNIANGYARFGSDALQLWYLRAGPNGLVPQYPVGSALAGAPLYAAFGVRGLIALNALATAGTLFVTRSLARALYADEATALLAPVLLLFGTYTLEYAFGIWPHAIDTFCVVAGLLLAVQSLDADDRTKVTRATSSGLLIGLGFLFRLDAILILPTIIAVIVLLARRPVLTLACGMAGMLPGLSVAAMANIIKFGTPNPLSYGPKVSGGADPAHYVGLAATTVLFFVLLLALRLFHRTFATYRAAFTGLTLAGLALALILVPALGHELEKVARGFYVLVLDIRPINDNGSSAIHTANGTVLFWGLYKKALGQSLPWLGILAAVFARRWRPIEWRGHAILLGGALLWMLPFLPSHWYGGLGSNMRYFLPILPLLASVSARIWTGVMAGPMHGREPMLWSFLGVAFVLVWIRTAPSGLGGAEQILPTYALAVMTSLAALTALPSPPRVKQLATAVARRGVLFTFGIAISLGPILDLSVSETLRSDAAQGARQLQALPTPALVIARPELTAARIGRPGYLAATEDHAGKVDVRLVNSALDAGYRVFVAHGLIAGVLSTDRRLRAATNVGGAASLRVTEVVRVSGKS